ncbi:RNA metabolism protein [Lithospermum erythrorhizon]|uniref:RNA metabolism protein n=1 Tax=Lithospermum erythrorhizon TaxID=34254 RepID=A0AAV3NK16_LITER
MKKKSTTTSAAASPDIKSLIPKHTEFFDNLISLIPGKFYLSNDDADSKPYFKGLSKAAKASFKQQTRQNIKLARRNRHDPEKISQSSTLDLLKQSLIKPEKIDEIENNNDDEDDINDLEETDKVENKDRSIGSESLTYEELRLRLKRKIELLRGNRGGEKLGKKAREGERKPKRHNENEEEGGENGGRGRNVDEVVEKGIEFGKLRNVDEVVEKGIEFGKLRIGDDQEKGVKKRKRKMPKAKELERAQRLEEMKRENPVVAEKESWKAATSRAYGAKVHDDPKLLKESIKKQKRKMVKSAEKWKERLDKTNKMKRDRQQKRTDNIAERAKDKKSRKIAKREKKLLRPGFEGRKEGYITKT